MLNQISEFFSKGFGPLGKAKPMLHLLRVVESRLFLGRLLHVQANYAFLSLDVCFNCGWCLAAAFCSRKGYLETLEVIGSPVLKSLWDGATILLQNSLSFLRVQYGFSMSGSSLKLLQHAVKTSHSLLHVIEDCRTGLLLSASPPLPSK